MKLIALAIVVNLSSLSCALISGALALHDRPGWGWFLLAACVLHAGVSFKEKRGG